jgi:hypothetical protein
MTRAGTMGARPMPPAAGARGPASGGAAGKEFWLAALVKVVWGLLKDRFLANMLFLAALVIGFLHGWLKMNYRYTWMTFAYDVPMLMSLGVVLLQLKRGDRLFPDCQVSTSLKVLIGFAVLYVAMPFGVPLLASLAAFRGWCFPPLMMLLGYHLVRSVRQMEIFVMIVLLLGTGTAIYGAFFQTTEDVRAMMELDPELEFRLRNTFYATKSGVAEFRRFSTYVTAAVFGYTMAICTTIAVSWLMMPRAGWVLRIVLLTCGALCAYGVVLTGSRTSLVLTILGVVLSSVFRKGGVKLMAVPMLLVGALIVGLALSGSAKVERFSSLLNFDEVFGRINIVLSPTIRMLIEYPLGGGLGRSGHGMAATLLSRLERYEIRGVDGDIGRLVVDMGICGLVVYVVLLHAGLSDSIRWLWKMRNSNMAAIASPIGAIFILALAQVITGSPYLGIPGGMLVWILFGGLRRMVEEYEQLEKMEGGGVEDLPQFVSFIKREQMSGLYGTPVPGAGPSLSEKQAAVGALEAGPKIRRLFSNEPRPRR